MAEDLAAIIESLVRMAPESWLTPVCSALRGVPPDASADFVLQRISATSNAGISFLMAELVGLAVGTLIELKAVG